MEDKKEKCVRVCLLFSIADATADGIHVELKAEAGSF